VPTLHVHLKRCIPSVRAPSSVPYSLRSILYTLFHRHPSIIYTLTQRSPSRRLLASSTPTPFVLEHQLQSSSEDLFFLGRIHSFCSDRVAYPRVYFSRHLSWSGAGIAITKDGSGGYTSGDAEGGELSVHGWGAAKIRESKNRSGLYWGAKGRVGGYGHASASNRTGRARMEWNFEREVRVWERTE